MDASLLTLFVYGSLKRGGSNHAVYCSESLGFRRAFVPGRLWVLPAGFPILEVPRGLKLAEGSHDLVGDAALSGPFTSKIWPPQVEAPFRWIEGELMTFADPAPMLHKLDEFEGFSPGKPSLYNRSLVAARTEDGVWTAAWAYTAPGLPEKDWAVHDQDCWP